MEMIAFYQRREAIKNEIEKGDGIWGVNPPICESEILAWISYMERLESDLEAKGEALVRMIDRLTETQKAAVRWITFDGTPETLPGIGETVLFDGGKDGAIVLFYRRSL